MGKLLTKEDGIQVGVIQPADSISKAGSTISKPVQESNQEVLNEFREKFGKLTKTRPERDPDSMSMQALHAGDVGKSQDGLEKHK